MILSIDFWGQQNAFAHLTKHPSTASVAASAASVSGCVLIEMNCNYRREKGLPHSGQRLEEIDLPGPGRASIYAPYAL